MSNRTRSELQKLKRKLKGAGVLARMGKISRAAISNILSGKSRPSSATVMKLATSLDKEAACALVAAYLTDEIPSHLRSFVRVEIRENQDGLWGPSESFYKKFDLLRPEARQLVEALVQELLDPHNPDSPLLYMGKTNVISTWDHAGHTRD
jgi:transcriptional regulator with XRE-family HTH domain